MQRHTMNRHRDSRPRGFSLIEMLVVVAIIVVLVTILLPVLSQAEEQGRMTVCLARLRQIHIASKQYANENRHLLPRITFTSVGGSSTDQSYSDAIIPYLVPGAGDTDGDGLVDGKWYENINHFRCPSVKADIKNAQAYNGQILDFGINNYGRLDDSKASQAKYYPSMSARQVTDIRTPRVIYYAESNYKSAARPETLGGTTRANGKLEWPLRSTFDEGAYIRHNWGYNAARLDGSCEWFDGRTPNHTEWWIEQRNDRWWNNEGGDDPNYKKKTEDFKDQTDKLKDKYGS
ncbi:MAG: prepilin-type N-terminal cleavage/methylation domain-containing protein [Phycisphaera sp.]|nr:prepilin-type N-terminal cleavage/methylation domain-containing protein [Phycisphaera sp.]